MKKNLAIFSIITAAVFLFTSCKKEKDLPFYEKGKAITVAASKTAVAAAAADSLANVIIFSWTNPNYAADSSTYKFVVEIDSAGRNFSKKASKTVTGKFNIAFTGKEINDILLNYGFSFGVAYDMDVRVISSYGNNNESYTSNTLKLKMTPYKIPPKVALPATSRLFIVGDASDFGWTNDAAPAFPAVREFTRIDETTWAGIFNLKNSGAYKLLQKQGDWGSQFHMVTGDALAGTFEQKDADPAFPSPSIAGAYKITIDFQTGKYTAKKLDNALGSGLYITGNATPSDWTNAPPAAQKFTQTTNGVFEITMAFVPGQYYKFLSSSGNWQPQFGGNSATGGTLGANYGGGNDPDAVPTPAAAGNYKITVNFITGVYTVTKL
jgi:starch-binding outer membrane protein SusE/F